MTTWDIFVRQHALASPLSALASPSSALASGSASPEKLSQTRCLRASASCRVCPRRSRKPRALRRHIEQHRSRLPLTVWVDTVGETPAHVLLVVLEWPPGRLARQPGTVWWLDTDAHDITITAALVGIVCRYLARALHCPARAVLRCVRFPAPQPCSVQAGDALCQSWVAFLVHHIVARHRDPVTVFDKLLRWPPCQRQRAVIAFASGAPVTQS